MQQVLMLHCVAKIILLMRAYFVMVPAPAVGTKFVGTMEDVAERSIAFHRHSRGCLSRL